MSEATRAFATTASTLVVQVDRYRVDMFYMETYVRQININIYIAMI
jgi:hypothetical protein